MDQNLKDAVLDNLTKTESIVIVVSRQLGFDGLASGLALYLSLLKLDKNVSIIAKNPTVGDAQSLYAVDKIGTAKNAKTPVIVVQNAIETVDKVTHFLEGDSLKLILHPLPGSPEIGTNQISLEYAFTPANLIFAIGIDNLPDLRSEFTHEQEINPEAMIISVSNTEPSQKFAQVNVVDPTVGSVSEVTAAMLQDLALPVDEDIAFNLYSGIKSATQNFSPSMVNAKSFEIASWLLKFGAGKASLARQFLPADAISEPMQPSSKQTQDFSRFPQPGPFMPQPLDTFQANVPIEEVETEPQEPETAKSGDWLKPPKIYKGSKAVGGENKG